MKRSWTFAIFIAAISGFALKLYWAYTTQGSPDISLWIDFLSRIRACGTCVYQTGGVMIEPQGPRVNPFNHPPFIMHYLQLLGLIADLAHLPFRFLFRLFTSVFDLGTLIVVYQLLRRLGLFTPPAYLLFVLAPATLIVSGYHGNTDPIMIFFLLLAILLLVSERPVWLAAISFGIALSFKVVPIIFGPAFFFYLSDFKKRAYFVSIVGLVFIGGALPYITIDPLLIFRQVFGYTSFPGRWGWTVALYAATHGEGIYSEVVRVGNYILLGFLTYRSYLMNRKSKPSLYLQVGSLAFLFMSFTTGWGTHYMSWLDPFAIGVGLMPGLLYYSASGAMLVNVYFVSEHEPTRLVGICWIAVLIVTSIYLRRTRPNRNLS